MRITVRKIGMEKAHGGENASGTTNIYRVIDNGREFAITYRTHGQGGNLGIKGQKGSLYTDTDTDTVCRQVIAVGRGCGISIERDEVVEGLSPWAIRGVIMAERSGETREISIIVAAAPEVDSDQPVVLVDGEVADLLKYLRLKS
jgi:hypothetical protein